MRFFSLLWIFCIAQCGYAQFKTPQYPIFSTWDAGVSVGSTGIGIEVSSYVGQYLKFRTGVDFMPCFTYPMDFGIQLGDEPVGKVDAQGNSTHFGRLSEMLYDMSGYEPNEYVTMEGKPSFINYKLLIDVLPFRDKHWRFTAGCYFGSSRVALAENAIEDAPTLMAVNMYNNMYKKVENEDDLFMGLELPPDVCDKILSYGTMGMTLGHYRRDIYDEKGLLLHKKGDPYRMVPNEDCMVKSKIVANKVRPYFGVGYSNDISNSRFQYSIDLGAMYMGDLHVFTHDGTCLSHDVESYSCSIRSCMNFFNHVNVYPVLNLQISYKLF